MLEARIIFLLFQSLKELLHVHGIGLRLGFFIGFLAFGQNCGRIEVRVFREFFDLFPALKNVIQVADIGPDRCQAGLFQNGLYATLFLDNLRVKQQVVDKVMQVAAVEVGQECQVLDPSGKAEA